MGNQNVPPPDKSPKPGLNIYVAPAVNPYKLTLLCEELEIPYHAIAINTQKGEQRSAWYTDINPNARLPSLVHVKEDGDVVKVWESAACMLYIIAVWDKEYKLSWPIETQEYWSMVAWLSWQVAGMGPMMGQAAHFTRYSWEDIPYGKRRYTAESRRLFSVMNTQLAKTPYLVGAKLSIADLACYIWAQSAAWCGIDINEFPAVKAWRDMIAKRPAVQRAMRVPVSYPFTDERVLDPKRKGLYEMIMKMGTESNRRELEELVKDRRGGGGEVGWVKL